MCKCDFRFRGSVSKVTPKIYRSCSVFPHRYFGSVWRTLPLNFFDGCRSFWFGSLSLNAEEWRKKSAGGFSPPHSPRFVNERFSHCHLFSFCRQRTFFEHWIFKSLNFFIRIGVFDNPLSYLYLWGYHFCLHRAYWSAQCSAMFWTWNRCMDCMYRRIVKGYSTYLQSLYPLLP